MHGYRRLKCLPFFWIVLLNVQSMEPPFIFSVVSSYNVAARGSHERAGDLHLVFWGDDLPLISPDESAYIRLKLDRGVVLADTRVDLQSSNPHLATPIYLRMRLFSDEAEYSLGVPGDAISIVDWRAGFSEIWIRIKYPTNTWVRRGQELIAPNRTNSVGIIIGEETGNIGGSQPQDLNKRNLPFNTRNWQLPVSTTSLEEAEVTLICIDLSNTELALDTSIYLGGDVYDHTAVVALGRYQAGTALPPKIIGGPAALLGLRQCSVTSREILPSQVPLLDEGWVDISEVLTFDRDCIFSNADLAGEIGPDSGLFFEVPEGSYGFTEDSVLLEDPSLAGVLTLENRQEVKGRVFYKRAQLSWSGSIPDLTRVRVKLLVEADSAPLDVVLRWNFVIRTNYCPDALETIGQGSWHLARMGPTAGARVFPHITRQDGGFQTRLIFTNPDEQTAFYHLTGYANNGLAIGSMPLLVPSNQTLAITPKDLFGGVDCAWISVPLSLGKDPLITYQADHCHGAPAMGTLQNQASTSVRLFPGDGELTWDGFALVNVGSQVAGVEISQTDFSGKELQQHNLNQLEPNQKTLFLPEQIFNMVGQFFFDITSTEPFYIIALRGDRTSDFLWVNPTISVRQ